MTQTHHIQVPTQHRDQMIDITQQVKDLIHTAPAPNGHAIVYVPHTTAAVTINENADPDVTHDVLNQLDHMVPHHQPFYQHAEGNSAAHVKAIITGSSVTVLFQNHQLILGQWQGIYFCEYDGPRTRSTIIQINHPL